MVNTVPDFCLPGGFEYQDALDKQVHACMIGEKKPKQALDEAARLFDRITKRIGKDKVKKSWLTLVKNLAAPVKKASGADTWKA
jgi:multiple sugar transport system substrate-binding protein